MLWLWATREASRALRSGDLGTILRTYRKINRFSQERLAAVLGYDKTYISMIETRRRVISDVSTLRHIAHTLGIPVHALGVTEPDDTTYLAMIQFADSILNLAEVARQSGRAVDAVNELWPLIARLEARAAEGLVDRDSLGLLGRARVALGVALGEVLPDEKLCTAARWTGQALQVAERLNQPATLAYTLAMHGNELRKAGHLAASVTRLRHALALSSELPASATACAMLARAAGETGDAELFDDTITNYRHLLDQAGDTDMFNSEFTFREIQLRGLVGTSRAHAAARLMAQPHHSTPAAPQWAVIEQITTGHVLLTIGDKCNAEGALLSAITGAQTYRLPHQLQRAARIAKNRLSSVEVVAHTALTRLNAQFSNPT